MKKSARNKNPRARTARILAAVLGRGRSLSAELDACHDLERPLIQSLSFGVLRTLGGLRPVLDSLLHKPLKSKDLDIQCLLLTGLYQLFEMRVPDHAAIGETAEAARELGKPWAVGLVNGLLRGAQRDREKLTARLDEGKALRSHPDWLARRLREAWPRQFTDIIAANDTHPPLWLRINRRRISRDAYTQTLHNADLSSSASAHVPDALRLDQAVAVERLPGFAEGLVSVQDAAAQLAAQILAPRPGQRVLDACAAPGGKTSHLLEYCGDCDVLALDNTEERLPRVRHNLQRLGLNARVVLGDASDPASWWDGRAFDRILLDAPCSATGVIRRHPDIRWLRQDRDIDALTAMQLRLLRALWPLLTPGGKLLYATCSILPEENHKQILDFLTQTPDAREEILTGEWGRSMPAGRQILPGEDGMDGFYYACLSKNP